MGTPPVPCPCRVPVPGCQAGAAITLAEVRRARGHELTSARSGEDALGTARACRPDTVLPDLGMPPGDGFEDVRAARLGHPAGGPVLVATTGYGHEIDRARSRAAGPDHPLVRPAGPRGRARPWTSPAESGPRGARP